MKLKKISINVSELPISIFGKCDERIAVAVMERILAHPEKEKILLKSCAIIVSSTGLSQALVTELQKKFRKDLPPIVMVELNSPAKKEIEKGASNLLSECEIAFSKKEMQFNMALHGFAIEAQRQLAGTYTKFQLNPNDQVAICMESFLLASLNKLLDVPGKEIPDDDRGDEEDFDDEQFSDEHVMH